MNDYALCSVLLCIYILTAIRLCLLVWVAHHYSQLSLLSHAERCYFWLMSLPLDSYLFVVTTFFINIVARIGGLDKFSCIPLRVFAHRHFQFRFFGHVEVVHYCPSTLSFLTLLS